MNPSLAAHLAAAEAATDGLLWSSRRSLLRLRQQGEALSLRALRVRSRSSGGRLSRLKGRGMEFDEARPYQPGDDVRSIDWRVTARRGRPHTKLFREERERAVICWVDLRAPMYFATQGAFKSVVATRAAAILGWSACAHGDRLGALLFSEAGHRELRPASGEPAVLQLIAQLAERSAQPASDHAPELRRAALYNALSRLRRVARPGALIFLISDFRDLDARCEGHLQALARHTEMILLQLYDPLEAELPKAGYYRLEGQQQTRLLDSSDPLQRQRYRERFAERLQQVELLCQRYRMHRLLGSTQDELFTLLRDGLGRQRT